MAQYQVSNGHSATSDVDADDLAYQVLYPLFLVVGKLWSTNVLSLHIHSKFSAATTEMKYYLLSYLLCFAISVLTYTIGSLYKAEQETVFIVRK